MKRILKLLLVALVIISGVVAVRTYIPAQAPQAGTPYVFEPDAGAIAQIMSEAVGYKTISYGRDKPTSAKELKAFHRFLRRKFPLVHRRLTHEVVADYSLLYTWKGSAPTQKPVVLLGHLDVVPVIPAQWKQPPFKGIIKDGFIWGRGTLDNKVNIVGILSAAEAMLREGKTPTRTIYFAFGHDEEQGGLDGARALAKVLKTRGVQAEFVLDEGGAVTSGVLPGSTTRMAVIAPAEKGIVTLTLTAPGDGGHSSTPPAQTAIGILAAGITKLEANQFPRDFSHTKTFFESIADDFALPLRIVMKNLWLFEPVVMFSLRNDFQVQAGMRTTTAATVIAGGVKSNVLPIRATAKVNFRILPGETPDTVRARVIEVMDDPRIDVAFDGSGQMGMGPSPVSPQAGYGWETIISAIRDISAPEKILIAPRLLVGATDTRHYREISPNHYRFVYMNVAREDLGGIHGTNERIGVNALKDTVRFFHRLMTSL
ncbi:MAG: M20/M25/M40 family metallo-hydrolase [Alphaproteobacteria bacterium]|nr:M20/M25/M40 family metallo-hydrolase [Alphaproteobacteria bacterium]